jgi:hypothetical protein
MGLRSGILLLTVGVVALALPVAAVLLWGSVRGPRPARAAARISMLVAAQLAAIVFAAVGLNDYGYFFDSWSQLFGSTAPGASAVAVHPQAAERHDMTLTMRHFGGADARPARSEWPAVPHRHRSSLPPRAGRLAFIDWSVRSQWPTRGAVARIGLASRESHVSTTGYVYLPPAYFRAWRGPVRLPVLEVFANQPDTSYDLVYRTPMPGYLLRAMATGQSPPYILVLLDTGSDPGQGGCVDRRGAQRLTFFAADVPRLISRVLRVDAPRYATLGFGSGGYCALRLGLADPSRFTRSASLLGCYAPVTGRPLGRRPVRPGAGARTDELTRMAHSDVAPGHFLVAPGLGASGPCGRRAAERFLRAVRAPASADEVGGYSRARLLFVVWKALLPRTFAWLCPYLSRAQRR